MKAVLITGCSEGGIGSSLVKAFQKRDYHVFATARDVTKMNALTSLPNVTLLKLEVTSSEDIRDAVTAVEQAGHSIETLVNNAGVAPVMPLLDANIEDAKKTFDANVWGCLALCQAFAPMLIQNRGTIVSVGSINALVKPIWMGVYNASKAAQHALMETLRTELEPLGVRVMTVVTGAIDTVVMTKQAGTFQLPTGSIYAAIAAQLRIRAEGEEKVPRTKPDVHAERVVADVVARKTGLTYRGMLSSSIYWLTTFFPFLTEMIRYREIGLAEFRKAVKASGSKKTS